MGNTWGLEGDEVLDKWGMEDENPVPTEAANDPEIAGGWDSALEVELWEPTGDTTSEEGTEASIEAAGFSSAVPPTPVAAEVTSDANQAAGGEGDSFRSIRVSLEGTSEC